MSPVGDINSIGESPGEHEEPLLLPIATRVEGEAPEASEVKLWMGKRSGKWTYQILVFGILCGVLMGCLAVFGVWPHSSDGNSEEIFADESRNCPLPDNGWESPEYVDESAFYQECVMIQDAQWEMSGALTVPHGEGPFPAVVLIGGSGPTDMDSTFSEHNKALKDIAWGLSSQGIVVLRFNKRTYQYADGSAPCGACPNNSVAEFTISDEYTDDTLAALNLVSTYDFVDESKIILAGHSLGGEVAPGIALRAGPLVSGVVLLAATPKSLPWLIPWQEFYLHNFNYTQGEYGTECRDLILNESLTPYHIVNCAAIAPSVAVFSNYGNYYLSEREYTPTADVVAQLNVPVFILQGKADFNVPYAIPPNVDFKDVPTFETWVDLYGDSDTVSLAAFGNLSHFFMNVSGVLGSEGFATVYEETLLNHVDPLVVSNLTEWIHSHF